MAGVQYPVLQDRSVFCYNYVENMCVFGKQSLFSYFLIFALCLSFAPAALAAEDESGEISAPPWKMAVLKKNSSGYESVPFRRPLTMTRRDSYRLDLSFEEKGCFYVIQEDDEGRLPFIYRKNVSGGETLSLPGGSSQGLDFICSDLPGTNRFYVIVSAQPRPNLERLIDQYERESAGSSLERSILSEVLGIRRSAASSETSPASEGEFTLFEGRNTRVITITIRVQ